MPIWFKLEPDDRLIIGFRGADATFIQNLPINTPVTLGPQEPPLDYLRNLIYLLDNAILYPKFWETVSLPINTSPWRPEPLENNSGTSLQLTAELAINRNVIIQGPPGTGKSYLIANLCNDFLRQGKTVLVTALTNAALTELAQKDGLANSIKEGRIYKTSLTLDECKQMPKLKNGADYQYQPGSLLLATYYKASGLAKTATGPQFDLVVIEEASQAFLATIGAIRHLGQNCVIIGDQMQLQPIRQVKDADLDSPELVNVFNGLNTVTNADLTPSAFILNKTFRLNPQTTFLTNAFYADALLSVQPPISQMDDLSAVSILLTENSVQCLKMQMAIGLKRPVEAIEAIKDLVGKLRKSNPKSDIAVLAAFVDTVKALQQAIYPEIGYSEKVIVDTIDRIQGLTVDVCIVLIPNTSTHFSLDIHRFNVATSRARRHTVLFVPNDLSLTNCDERVIKYFERLKG